MSIIGSNILAGAAGSGVSAYQIEQSLRFRGAQWLSRTPSSNGNRQTYTHSVWIKKEGVTGTITSAGSNTIFSTQQQSTQERFRTGNSETTGLAQIWAAGGKYISGLGRYTDPAGWYHLVAVFDSTEASSSDRLKIYLNGNLLSTGSNATITLNQNWTWNSTLVHHIGKLNTNDGTSPWDTDFAKYYMAEYHMVDGTALSHTDFGEFDNNGVWRPIEYTGSYGTNGFYLKFDPSATNGIGHDHSGNGNNWTPTGFTTSGTGTDVMSDTPTTNWCTLNPLDRLSTAASLANGNLDVTTSAGSGVKGTCAMLDGKYYFETTVGSTGTNIWVGIRNTINTQHYLYAQSGLKSDISTSSSYGASTTTGDVIGVAFDSSAGSLVFYKNGTSQGTAFTGISSSDTWVPFFFTNPSVSTAWVFNFGQRAFAYTPPTGFKALNTANLPAPDIADGSQYFDTKLYTGNGGSNSITGLNFSPDFLWIKNRDASVNHQLHDIVRGASVGLNSNNTNVEFTDANAVTSFDSAGWSMNNNYNSHNQSSVAYAAWCWDAGGSGSSNTDGSITSTVSANPTAGFSIVSYTAENAVRTIGHGLGVAPKLIIVKDREATQNWAVYHGSLGATKGLYLDTAAKQETNSGYWNNTEPTSTVFTVGTNTRTGGSTNDYIAYCFVEIDGYSRMSTYSANGSTDGPAVFCGFRPSVLIIKNYAGGSETDWVIKDAVRDTYNPSTKRLNPNQAYAESDDSNVDIDFLANGFKVRSTNTSVNESGSLYLFIAFASNPFGGSGVSPATAR